MTVYHRFCNRIVSIGSQLDRANLKTSTIFEFFTTSVWLTLKLLLQTLVHCLRHVKTHLLMFLMDIQTDWDQYLDDVIWPVLASFGLFQQGEFRS